MNITMGCLDIQVQAKLSLLSEGEAAHPRRPSSLHPSLAASPLPPSTFPEPLPYPSQPSPYQQWTEPVNQVQGLAGGYGGEEQPMGHFPNQGGGKIHLLFSTPQLLKFPPSPGGQTYPSQEPVYETVPGSFVPSSALHTMDPPLIPSSPGPSPGPTSYESLVPASPGQSYYSSLPAEGGFASFQGPHQGFVGDAGSQGYHSARSQGPQAYPGGGGSLGFLAAGGGSDLAVGMDPLLATSRCEPAAWSHKHFGLRTYCSAIKCRWERGSRYGEVPEGRSLSER